MTEGYEAVYHPSLAERFWRWAGFRYVHVDLPPEAEKLPGWMVTETKLRFSVGDRLRLLFGGRLNLRTVTQTDVSVSTAVSATSLHFVPPYGRGSD